MLREQSNFLWLELLAHIFDVDNCRHFFLALIFQIKHNLTQPSVTETNST
jgi:hypothetical protein